jgi:hypothetical protein
MTLVSDYQFAGDSVTVKTTVPAVFSDLGSYLGVYYWETVAAQNTICTILFYDPPQSTASLYFNGAYEYWVAQGVIVPDSRYVSCSPPGGGS